MLTHLFKQSLDVGELPQEWKSAFITPIFKKGKISNLSNYHSVSLNSIICKTIEHMYILFSEIMKHLEANNIICNNQYGFRNKHSCESRILTRGPKQFQETRRARPSAARAWFNNQYGFRNRHSCESQLLVTIIDFALALNNKLQVDISILDFSKAFDKVPHIRLIKKLEHYGVRGKVLQWIKSFLCNFSQCVVVEGCYSNHCEVTSGVPQDSVL